MRKIAINQDDQGSGKEISFVSLYVFIFFSIAFYTSMEWLYYVTKPSFMSGMDVWGIIKVWLQTNFVVFLAAFSVSSLLFLCARVIPNFTVRHIFLWASGFIPVFFVGITILLLVDNFTYTLFQVGVVSTTGIFRGIYGLSFLFLLIRLFKEILPALRNNPETFTKSPQFWIPSSILVLSLFVTLLTIPHDHYTWTLSGPDAVKNKPNIILLGSDGISASNLSLYSYERGTTPYLKKLSSESLLMKNHLSNSGKTGGSVTSIFTGKLPSKTRVTFPPDLLRSIDAYQHLPGILKVMGYKTVEFTVPHYLDATELNILNGFDQVNEKLVNNGSAIQMLRAVVSNDIVFFLETIYERIYDRLCHIFYIRKMDNAWLIVTQASSPEGDEERLTRLDTLIKEEKEPFFVHVHLMGTHGDFFIPRAQQFSKGKVQDQPWMTDFYDDTLLDFDENVKRVVISLEEAGKLDNTILILYTDHALNWKPLERIPLMIRFPGGEYAGTISENTQNLDISPTILDYLHIPQPSWMGGHSLLHGNPPALRPIFSANVEKTEAVGDGFQYHNNASNPPFYQFDYFTASVCDKWVKFSTSDNHWSVGTLDSEPGLCEGVTVSSTYQMEKDLLEQLKMDGFDISSVHLKE